MRSDIAAIDWTEGGRYTVREVRFGDGHVEIRRDRKCACGCTWDADLTSECAICEREA